MRPNLPRCLIRGTGRRAVPRSAPYLPPRRLLSYGRCHPSLASAILQKKNKNGGALPESIVDHGKRELNVLRNAVDPDALDDGIDLMSPPGTLALLSVVHDSVLNLRIAIRAVIATNAAACSTLL
jgi:hypothetical protein